LRNDSNGSLQALLTFTPEVPVGKNFELMFEGSSPDLNHIVLASPSALTPGSISSSSGSYTNNLYEWSDGQFYAINILPGVTGGQTVPGTHLGAEVFNAAGDVDRAVSDDGSRVFWAVGGAGEESLYVRENPTQPQSPLGVDGHCLVREDACTVLLGAKATYWDASSDGETAFFTEGGDLFEFDAASGISRDLTVDGEQGGAGVLGVLGASEYSSESENGSYVYFVANGRLAPGAKEGNCVGCMYHTMVGWP
jgi:hypothetical protein